ncbi:MAG: cobalt-zinc-cadmium efflux system membrane fusion protein [Polaromonas sp.]|jgi:cobalt-zinc-cadmium efflux system membrane fusion protein
MQHPAVKPLSALPILLSLLVLAGCQEAVEPPAKAPPPILQGEQLRFAPNHPQLALISLVSATTAQAITVDLPARMVWNEERTQRIYPAFAGRVSAIQADVGQAVNAGSVLAQLASPDFGMAQADTAKARADARLSGNALQRQRELFDAGIVPRKDLDQAEADASRALAEVQRADARTRMYGGHEAGSVNQALALSASVKGVVVERNLNPGQEVRPDQSGVGVPPLFVVTDPTTLWVQIDARESEVATLRLGAPFELIVPTLPGQKFEGRVTAAADYIDPITRSIKVRGLVANPARLLKAEMLATARIQRNIGPGVLVPSRSVALQGAKNTVLVQVQPGVFEAREVQLSYQGPHGSVVSSGIAAGELVVSDNMLLLAREFRNAKNEAQPLVNAERKASTAAAAATATAAATGQAKP